MSEVWCPTGLKARHASQAAAEDVAEAMQRTNGGAPREVYECRCGAWHVRRAPLTVGQNGGTA